MKIYFLSDTRAALKLDGEYVGIIDGFARWCEVDTAKGVLCEAVPGGNMQQVNFFIDEKFFRKSHSFADVYRAETFNAIYMRSFYHKDAALKVIAQRRFAGVTVTVYRQCGLFLCCEGEHFENYPLPYGFTEPYFEEVRVCGKHILAVYGGKWIALIDQGGRLLFLNEVESHSFGDILGVTVPLHTCEDAVADCSFTLDGGTFRAVNTTVQPRHVQDSVMLAFTFFERVLYSADYGCMLCDELKAKAGSIKKYLGEYTAVTVPDEDFYRRHDEKYAAGLVYPKDENLYDIIYYALDEEDGRITNVRSV